MIAVVDVDYRDACAIAACVLVNDWTDAEPELEIVESIAHVEDYVPGQFYKRELPCLLAVLAKSPHLIETIVIDGYVWLGPDKPGLGAHLFDALGRSMKVVGVAKTKFLSAADVAIDVLRGGSKSPLAVSAAGFDLTGAGNHVRSMHGEFRIPSLIKRVDRLCRDSRC